MCDEAACALQKILAEIARLDDSLLSRDAYDRWSHAAPAQLEANLKAMQEEEHQVAALQKQLKAEVKKLRTVNPGAVMEWAEAHEALLTNFIAKMRKEPEKNRTEIYVAESELSEWKKLRHGKTSFVDQNTFYVHYDAMLYRSYFG